MNPTIRQYRFLLSALIGVALVLGFHALSTAQTAVDPVEQLQKTLNDTVDDLPNRDRQTKAALAALHTLSDLRKAIVLREWRHQNVSLALAAMDRANRNALGERFRHVTHQVLTTGEPGALLAALQMLGETAESMRTFGESSELSRPLTAEVVHLVGHEDPAVRAAAAQTLGQIDADAAVALPVLTGQAKTTNAALRIDAATALGQMFQTAAEPWMANVFNPAALPSRRATVEQTAKLLPLAGASAVDPNREVRRRSLTTLADTAELLVRLTPPVSADMLDLNEVRPLATALHDLLKTVARCLRDHNGEVKMLALKVLEATAKARLRWLQQASVTTLPNDAPDDLFAPGLSEAQPALATTLTDEDVNVRRATLDVLELYGPLASASAPAVALALRDQDRYVRWEAARTLGAIGPAALPALPALTKLLDDPDTDVRLAAAAVMQALDPKGEGPPKKNGKPNDFTLHPNPIVAALIHSLDSDQAEMRLTAMHALAGMGKEAQPAVPALAKAVHDPDAHVRLAAVRTLGALGPAARTVADTLRLALKDDDADVRRAAGDALLGLEREP